MSYRKFKAGAAVFLLGLVSVPVAYAQDATSGAKDDMSSESASKTEKVTISKTEKVTISKTEKVTIQDVIRVESDGYKKVTYIVLWNGTRAAVDDTLALTDFRVGDTVKISVSRHKFTSGTTERKSINFLLMDGGSAKK